jgi:hypothetical protein
MKVAQQGDAEPLESLGPAAEGDLLAHDSRKVWLDEYGVGSECSHASGRCEADKLPPGRR